MIILAHRANLSGPKPKEENSETTTLRALELGFGIETDLRRSPEGTFYIAHDAQAQTPGNDFRTFAKLFRQFPDRVIAMNVKELGYEQELIDIQERGDLGSRSFYFDFELLEKATPGKAQRLIRSLPGGSQTMLASRLSDHGETLEQCLAIPANVVWADEFDKLWLQREDIEKIHATGRQVYAISPELHGFSENDMRGRWVDFQQWGIDGICTDYALSAKEFFLG